MPSASADTRSTLSADAREPLNIHWRCSSRRSDIAKDDVRTGRRPDVSPSAQMLDLATRGAKDSPENHTSATACEASVGNEIRYGDRVLQKAFVTGARSNEALTFSDEHFDERG